LYSLRNNDSQALNGTLTTLPAEQNTSRGSKVVASQGDAF
jgi:hypothetical protein